MKIRKLYEGLGKEFGWQNVQPRQMSWKAESTGMFKKQKGQPCAWSVVSV